MASEIITNTFVSEVRNDILTVLADGQSTASTYRDKVLKTEDSASVALKYNDIIAMKRAERSALVKGMDVVYIYHDTIDEASHTSDTFSRCKSIKFRISAQEFYRHQVIWLHTFLHNCISSAIFHTSPVTFFFYHIRV